MKRLSVFAWIGSAALIAVASQIWLAAIAPALTHQTALKLSGVLPILTVLPLSTALVLWLLWRQGQMQSGMAALLALCAAGLAMRLAWFGSPAPIEDDFYRYLWDGALVANGLNPYDLSPRDVLTGLEAGGLDPLLARLAAEGKDVLSKINFPSLRTIYPGTAQAAFSLAYWIKPWSLDALRFVFLVADCVTLILSIALLRGLGANPLWAGLYWCNPFVSTVLIGAAHADVLIAPFVLGALLLVTAGRAGLGGASLALATGVKLWPVLLVPLLTRLMLRQPGKLIRALTAFTVMTVLLAGPLVWSSFDSDGGLRAYASTWANNNAVFAWLKEILAFVTDEADAGALLRLAFAGLAVAIALLTPRRRVTDLQDLSSRALIISAAVFYCSPAQFPWYASWFLPLAAILQSWPLLIVSVLLPAYYLFFPSWQTSMFPFFIFGAAFLHWLPLLWLLKRALATSHGLSLYKPAGAE